MYTISNRWTGKPIYTSKTATCIREAVEEMCRKAVAENRRADLTDADLTRADLTDAVLTRAVLTDAVLTDADLTRADLTDAALPLWIPRVPMLHCKILEAIEVGGGFDMNSWHGENQNVCDTTHCRSGWSIFLAGEAGRVLEGCLGPSVAGALIALASTPELDGKVPDFYADNETALADIRRVAELERASSMNVQKA